MHNSCYASEYFKHDEISQESTADSEPDNVLFQLHVNVVNVEGTLQPFKYWHRKERCSNRAKDCHHDNVHGPGTLAKPQPSTRWKPSASSTMSPTLMLVHVAPRL